MDWRTTKIYKRILKSNGKGKDSLVALLQNPRYAKRPRFAYSFYRLWRFDSCRRCSVACAIKSTTQFYLPTANPFQSNTG
jgi:hypothetical protein